MCRNWEPAQHGHEQQCIRRGIKLCIEGRIRVDRRCLKTGSLALAAWMDRFPAWLADPIASDPSPPPVVDDGPSSVCLSMLEPGTRVPGFPVLQRRAMLASQHGMHGMSTTLSLTELGHLAAESAAGVGTEEREREASQFATDI